MATCLDHHDPGRLAATIPNVSDLRPDDSAANVARADSDLRYALWLTLATWRPENVAGASPRSAAFAAWTGVAADPEIIPPPTRALQAIPTSRGLGS
jgi:hypothetical protein